MTRRSSIPVWAALLGSGLAGMLVAVQTRLNGGLSQAIHDPYLTAAISFLLGLSIITIVMLATARGRRGITRLRGELKGGRLPWWALTGGAFGAFFVLGQGLIATVIGLALFTVGVVAGQVLGGLVIDRIGLGPGGRVDPTVQRLVGTEAACRRYRLDAGEERGNLVPVHGMAASAVRCQRRRLQHEFVAERAGVDEFAAHP